MERKRKNRVSWDRDRSYLPALNVKMEAETHAQRKRQQESMCFKSPRAPAYLDPYTYRPSERTIVLIIGNSFCQVLFLIHHRWENWYYMGNIRLRDSISQVWVQMFPPCWCGKTPLDILVVSPLILLWLVTFWFRHNPHVLRWLTKKALADSKTCQSTIFAAFLLLPSGKLT